MLSRIIITLAFVFSFTANAAVTNERAKFECGGGGASGAAITVFYDITTTSYTMLMAGTDGGAGYATFVDQDRNAYTPPSGKKAIVDCMKWMNTDNVNAPSGLTFSTAAGSGNWETTAPSGSTKLFGDHNGNEPIMFLPSPTYALYGYHPLIGVEFTNGTYMNLYKISATGDVWMVAYIREVDE
jgi:hypothetical protein